MPNPSTGGECRRRTAVPGGEAAVEIFLRIESEDRQHLGDVAVRAEPSHTVADLIAAVARFLGLDSGLGRVVSRADFGPLDSGLTLTEAGLVSGQTLILGRVWPRPEGRVGELMLVVASGPDTGLAIDLDLDPDLDLDLGPGSWSLGRDADCDLTLSDPQVSRRHLQFTVDDDQVFVEVLVRDRNEARTLGQTILGRQPVSPGQAIRLGASTVVVRRRPPAQHGQLDAFGQVRFHRTPHFPSPVLPVTIEALKDIPTKPDRSRFAYLSALLPVLMGVSFAVLFNNPRYLMFAAFSPLMVIGNYFEQRRRTGNDFRRSIERFDEELRSKAVEVREALAAERERRFAAAPDVADLRDRAANRSLDLWVRDRNAYNFLSLRVGVGDLPATVTVAYSDAGDPGYRDQIAAAYGNTTTITDVPVVVDLADLGALALVGGVADTSALASSLTLQAAALHSPEDLVMAAAVSPRRGMAGWLKWLPHCRAASSPLAGPHLAQSKQQADALVSEVLAEVVRRHDRGREPVGFPRLLVLLDRALEPDAAITSRLLDLGPEVGVSVLWLTDSLQRVPRQARAVVECVLAVAGRLSSISFTDPNRPDLALDIERAGPDFSGLAARALAPLRDASSANAATAIPRTVPLFTALGTEAVDADWVAERWRTDRGYSLQGPIGCTESGPLMLDIVEHGPHGLIGGTSGAGKSELVMSLVAGLIAYNPPTRVNFLFIDYKGGASSEVFTDVPHTVGYVTNLDGLLAMRALTSLRAELNRRMNLLQGRAKDLEEMLARHPEQAPASLVIVVDEFATLVQEIPDFVSGIVDIAQRGRSLGIHLLLATQRPSGSVNDNIKANTNLRIALRMLDGGESTAVIGSGDAASIPAPLKGRGFARMGSGELTAFQSAWAGAPLLGEVGAPPVEVKPFGPCSGPGPGLPLGSDRGLSLGSALPPPEHRLAGSPVATKTPAPERTQIDAVVEAVVAAGNQLGYERGRAPWLDTLPELLSIEEVRGIDASRGPAGSRDQAGPGSRIVFGMVDDPATQSQYPAVADLACSGGLLVCGAGGSGRSTVLETVAVSAALDDSALGGGQLTIFALEFASRQLGSLVHLPQCGGVAGGDDLEAVTRIIALLHTEFERRRQVQAEAAVRSQAPVDHPSVLLLIDGLEALTQTMEQSASGGPTAGLGQYHAELLKVITDGRQVGMYPIVTASRPAAVRASLAAVLSDRLILRQTDAQAYADCGIGAAEAKALRLAPGQGFFNGPNLVQVAKVTGCPNAVPEPDPDLDRDWSEQTDRLRFTRLAKGLSGRVDPRLQTRPLPHALGLLRSDDPLRPVIGLADLSGDPITLDLTHNNLSIIGDPRSGRSTALATIGAQAASAGAEVWVLAGPGSALDGFDRATRSCVAEGAERQVFLDDLVEQLQQESAGERPKPGPRLFLVDDVDLLPEQDRPLLAALETILGTVRYAAAGSKPRGFSAHPVVQQVRTCRSVIYLRPHDPREAHEVLGLPVPWHPGLAMVEGRGLVVVDRQPTIVQLSSALLGDALLAST